MKNVKLNYSTVVSTLALFVALGGGAYAASIAKNSVGSKQLKANSVKSAEIAKRSVASSEIENGEVLPPDLQLPAPALLRQSGEVAATPGDQYAKIATLGTYAKQDASSVLRIAWSGSIGAGFSPCVFQLRVDGQADDRNAAEVFVQNSNTESASVDALFSGLAAGPHDIEVWARATSGGASVCTLSPTAAGIGQTAVVEEAVV